LSSFSRASISLFFSARKFMRKKISVIGEGVEIAQELARMADVGNDVRGADVVVVVAGEGDLARISRSAPAAALLMAGDNLEARCQQAYEATLFPRARIVGIADAARLGAAIESIVLERDDAHDVIAMRDGKFGPCSARLGRGGIRELL
jgi:hypothetical protein